MGVRVPAPLGGYHLPSCRCNGCQIERPPRRCMTGWNPYTGPYPCSLCERGQYFRCAFERIARGMEWTFDLNARAWQWMGSLLGTCLVWVFFTKDEVPSYHPPEFDPEVLWPIMYRNGYPPRRQADRAAPGTDSTGVR